MSDLPRKISCEERDGILHEYGSFEGWKVYSSLTDPHGEFGEPLITTTWEREGRFIEDIRYPFQGSYSPPDRKPCEHYELNPKDYNE